MNKKTAPYGAWDSPITSDLIVGGSIGLDQFVLDGETVYWLESRPSEGGRTVIVRWTPDGSMDVTPRDFNARTRAHEYGGGAFTVQDGELFFANFADQHIYRQSPGQPPRPITQQNGMRYADFVPNGRGHLLGVREDHTGTDEAVNTLVSLDAEGGEDSQLLASGHNFFSSPRLSPNGRFLAYLTWDHPNMPWDSTQLWLAELQPDGTLANTQLIAGGPHESVFQPEWSPDGVLHFVSDRHEGWWNLYRWQNGQLEALHPMTAEFGRPQWVFGMSNYGFETADSLICTYNVNGIWHLARLKNGQLTDIPTPFTTIRELKAAAGYAVFLGGAATIPTSLVRLNLKTQEFEILRQSIDLSVSETYFSQPVTIEFPTEGNLTAYGFFYPPHNPDYAAPTGEKPPLLVLSHGGPTSATQSTLSLGIQYWTSRGFGVLDVNYGGSTGYGRSYRQRLYGQWGVVDVQDCINGAKYLAAEGHVDGERLAIRGGSAGGYTTLCAITFHNVFKAGASHFGIGDLEALHTDTHKFESRYDEQLIGSYTTQRHLYRQRSPIHYVDQINAALILFQGLDDKVVPPNQAEMMFTAVKAKGLPVAYVPFAGEGHGFRRAENIKRALDAELYFYSKIFRFDLPTPIEPVPIENL